MVVGTRLGHFEHGQGQVNGASRRVNSHVHQHLNGGTTWILNTQFLQAIII